MPVLVTDEHHAMGTCRQFLVFMWRNRTEASAMRGGAEALTNLIRQHPDGVGIIHVVEPQSVPPDSAAREVLFDTIRRCSPPLTGTSVIAEGGGFRTAFVRSVVTGMTLITRLDSPLRVFGSLGPAMDWHVDVMGISPLPTKQEIAQFVDALRAKLDALGPQ